MAKGHLNVLKGNSPNGAQLDDVLAVDAASTTVIRGTPMKRTSAGKFIATVAGDATVANVPLYVSMDDNGSSSTNIANAVAGLSLEQPLVLEVDQFLGNITGDNVEIAVGAGKFKAAVSGDTVIGRTVKGGTHNRWINDKEVSDYQGRVRNGARGMVLTFATCAFYTKA